LSVLSKEGQKIRASLVCSQAQISRNVGRSLRYVCVTNAGYSQCHLLASTTHSTYYVPAYLHI